MSDINNLTDLLIDLTSLSSVSGMEQAVVKQIHKELKPLSDQITVDSFGNIVATRFGDTNGPSLMIAAHSDEVGGLITYIDENGFLFFKLIGVVNPAILPSMRVRVANNIIGTVGSTPGHLIDEADVGVVKPAKELFIDVGASSDVEARSWGISEGSAVVFDSPLVKLRRPNMLMGKAIDNRVGCAILIKLFEAIRGKKLSGNVFGVVNVQEEIGMRGAGMTAAKIQPDLAIVLDTVPVDDTPNLRHQYVRINIGSGPVLQLWEGKAELFLGTVAHPAVNQLIQNAAAELQIPLQISAEYGSWVTDGAVIHKSGTGIPTGFISIPRRYAHTPNEILDVNDAQMALSLLVKIVTESRVDFNSNFIQSEELQ